MEGINRRQAILYSAIAIAVAVVGWYYTHRDTESRGQTAAAAPVVIRNASTRKVVHVTGAVRKPGVYRLRGVRVGDALRRAGGASGDADLMAINLAAKLADGQQIVVPERAAQTPAGLTGAPNAGGGPAAGPKVSLGNATVAQLDELDGVGPVTAEKIVEYRTEHGGFGSLDQLREIPGIGPKRFEALKESLQP